MSALHQARVFEPEPFVIPHPGGSALVLTKATLAVQVREWEGVVNGGNNGDRGA